MIVKGICNRIILTLGWLISRISIVDVLQNLYNYYLSLRSSDQLVLLLTTRLAILSAKYSFNVNFGQYSKFYIFESKSPYSMSGSKAVADGLVGQVLAGPLNVFLKV